jgi:hypothetical protein
MTVHEAPVGATVEWYTPRSLARELRGDGKHIDHAPGAGDDGCAYCVRYRAVRAFDAALSDDREAGR